MGTPSSTTLALGVNGLSPVIPGDLNFPNIGTYGPGIVLLDQGFVGGSGDVTVSATAVPEPPVVTLVFSGLVLLLILSCSRNSPLRR